MVLAIICLILLLIACTMLLWGFLDNKGYGDGLISWGAFCLLAAVLGFGLGIPFNPTKYKVMEYYGFSYSKTPAAILVEFNKGQTLTYTDAFNYNNIEKYHTVVEKQGINFYGIECGQPTYSFK